MYKEIDNLIERYKTTSGLIRLIKNNKKFTSAQKKEVLNYFLKRERIVINEFKKFFNIKITKMTITQKELLKKAIEVYCSLPVDNWYNQCYIDQITIGSYYVDIKLNQYDIYIIVNSFDKVNGKDILDVSFTRLIDGINEPFKCYETAYNYVSIDMPENYIYSGK